MEPIIYLKITKEDQIKPEKPFRISFSFKTDIGGFRFKGGDTIEEIKELLPDAIQDAGALYRLTKCFMEMVEDGPTGKL
jgi:hypothetical protein